MPTIQEFVTGVYQLPSEATRRDGIASVFSLSGAVAESMWSILQQASTHEGKLGEIATCYRLMNECLTEVERNEWLVSPHFVESLHAISIRNPHLQEWHQRVATKSFNDVADLADPRDAGYLGVFLTSLAAHDETDFQGRFPLRTDLLGRLTFPATDWLIRITSIDSSEVLSREFVLLTVDSGSASFYRDGVSTPFLSIPRDAFLRLLANESDGISAQSYQAGQAASTIFRVAMISDSQVRYDPAYFALEQHDSIVGGLVEQILLSIRDFSPALFDEFNLYIKSVRGYEIPVIDGNLIGSFSDPTQPGVMNINVTFRNEEPCLSPYSFTWFGHELAHTKNYLIDTVAFHHGLFFVENRSELTRTIPRYGRPLPVRTLVQIPFVHLYEWESLMDAFAAGIHLLPWVNADDPVYLVDELRAEIAEGFELISEYALLTQLGAAALQHQQELYGRCKGRWAKLRRVMPC